MFLNKERWFYCIAGVILGFLLSEFRSPAIEFWIETFGSSERKLAQNYKRMRAQVEKNLLYEEARDWQIKCIRKEIERWKEKYCESSIYYERGFSNGRATWLVNSTECLEDFGLEVALTAREWLSNKFPDRSRIKESEVARINGLCK